MGQRYFRLRVCCRDFQVHAEDQQTLSWEQFFFLRSKFMPCFSSNFSLGNRRAFFIYLVTPSKASRNDEIQSGHSLKCLSQPCEPSSYHNPILEMGRAGLWEHIST
jgi:hypothetical protein